MKVTNFLCGVYYQFRGFRDTVLDKGGDIKGPGFGRQGGECNWYPPYTPFVCRNLVSGRGVTPASSPVTGDHFLGDIWVNYRRKESRIARQLCHQAAFPQADRPTQVDKTSNWIDWHWYLADKGREIKHTCKRSWHFCAVLFLSFSTDNLARKRLKHTKKDRRLTLKNTSFFFLIFISIFLYVQNTFLAPFEEKNTKD